MGEDDTRRARNQARESTSLAEDPQLSNQASKIGVKCQRDQEIKIGDVDMSSKEFDIRLGTVPFPMRPHCPTLYGTLDYLDTHGCSVWQELGRG